jgi:hypothetical protein
VGSVQRQRVQAAGGTPGQEHQQIGGGVFAGGALEPAQIGRCGRMQRRLRRRGRGSGSHGEVGGSSDDRHGTTMRPGPFHSQRGKTWSCGWHGRASRAIGGMVARSAQSGRSGWPQRTLSAADPVGRSARYLRQKRVLLKAVTCPPTCSANHVGVRQPGAGGMLVKHQAHHDGVPEVPIAATPVSTQSAFDKESS